MTKKILSLAAVAALAVPAAASAAPKPKVQLSASTYAVAENAGSAAITVNRPGNGGPRLNQSVLVDYATSDGTGAAGRDYTATNGSLTFASGEKSKTFSVPVIDNDRSDGPRTVNIKISNPRTATGGRATLGFPSTATLVISDDEPATAGGGTGSAFQLAEASDVVSEADGSVRAYIIRSGDLSRSATVNYATADGSALAGTDYTAPSGTSWTFPSQAAAPTPADAVIHAIDIPLLPNTTSTDATRSFSFALGLPLGSSNTLVTPSSKTITIVNQDGTPTIQWSAPSFAAGENAGSVRLTAFMSGSISGTGEVDVDYRTADGSALAGVNYTSEADTLAFVAGDIAQSVDVAVMPDGTLGDKYFTTTLAIAPTSTSAGVLGSVATATVNVLNTDAASPVQNDASNGGSNTGGTTVVNETTNVTNNNTTQGGDQIVLGARQSACGLITFFKRTQKVLKQKALRIGVQTRAACKLSVSATVTQVKASKKTAKSARALRFKGKGTKLALQPNKAKTVKVKFTKKTLKAIKKALKGRKKLVATVVVTTRDAASKVNKKTLKITIKR